MARFGRSFPMPRRLVRKPPIIGILQTLGLSDTVTLSDSPVKGFGKNNSDSITLSDVFANVWAASRTPADTITLSDAISNKPGKNFSDTITLSDLLNEGICDSYSESNWISAVDGLASTFDTQAGQSFTGDGGTLSKCKFYIKRDGSPTGNVRVHIYNHTGTFGSGGLPTGSSIATSDNLDITSLSPTTLTLETFTFSGANKIPLNNGIKYCVVMEYTSGNSSNQLRYGYDTTSTTHGGNMVVYQGFWYCPDVAWDIIFYVYTQPTDLFKAIGKALADTITLSDSLVRGVGKAISDTITLTDNFISAIVQFFTLSLSDTVTLSDSIISRGFGKVISDSIRLFDFLWSNLRRLTSLFSSQSPTSSTWSKENPTSSSWSKDEPESGGFTKRNPTSNNWEEDVPGD